MCKAADIDGWFCVPHLADDDYVARMAKLLAEQMPEGKKVYVEYSNETWNGQFAQAKYCQQRGKELGLSKNDYEAQLRYSARRSVEVFKIFAEAFGGTDRLVRVIATHSANPWSGTTELDFEDAFKSADAVAIAPYFGNAFGDPKGAGRDRETHRLMNCWTAWKSRSPRTARRSPPMRRWRRRKS